MDGNSTSGTKTIGSSSASSRSSLLNTTMPLIDNDNVDCVRVGSVTTIDNLALKMLVHLFH
jgi:hypothetical protein